MFAYSQFFLSLFLRLSAVASDAFPLEQPSIQHLGYYCRYICIILMNNLLCLPDMECLRRTLPETREKKMLPNIFLWCRRNQRWRISDAWSEFFPWAVRKTRTYRNNGVSIEGHGIQYCRDVCKVIGVSLMWPHDADSRQPNRRVYAWSL